MSRLTEVTSNLRILNLETNYSSPNLKGLRSLKRIEGNLILSVSGPAFEGLDSLEYIGGNLTVTEAFNFTGDFSAFKSLRYVEGVLEIDLMGIEPISLAGLSKLESVGGITLGNSQINNFEGLESLKVIRGDLIVTARGDIGSFRGLEKVERITGDLSVFQQSISDLRGLNGLEQLGG